MSFARSLAAVDGEDPENYTPVGVAVAPEVAGWPTRIRIAWIAPPLIGPVARTYVPT